MPCRAYFADLLRATPLRLFHFFLVFTCTLSSPAAPQLPVSGGLAVRVRDASGTPLPVAALVRLTARVGPFRQESYTRDDVQVVFRTVPAGEYRIEVTAAGYRPAQQDVNIGAGESHIWVHMWPESAPAQPAPAGDPILAPKARKQLEAGIDALEKGNLPLAQAEFEKVVKLAPGYPDVYYLLGVVFQRKHDSPQARTFFEKAITLQPSHARALLALGRLLHGEKKFDEAAAMLERGLAVDNVNWQGHWALALTQLERNQPARARVHAERAAHLAGEKAPQIALLLAETLRRLNENEQAAATLDRFLRDHPQHPAAASARAQLAKLRPRSASAPGNGDGAPKNPSTAITLPAPDSEPELPAIGWPKDVESLGARVDQSVSCSLPTVLRLAGREVQRLVENLQGVTARERIESEEFDRAGQARQALVHLYEYMMLIQEPQRGVIYVEEDRRAVGKNVGTSRLASDGLPALALILHPYYAGDYEMKCEGLGQADGRPAWQIYFRQRADRESRVRVYRTRQGRFPVPLKGRAWVDAGNYQLLRMETGMVRPLPDAQLQAEHLSVVYAPVSFAQRNLRLWLPLRVDFYSHFRKKRLHMRHSFSDFTYFAVDVKQKIHDPKVEPPPNP